MVVRRPIAVVNNRSSSRRSLTAMSINPRRDDRAFESLLTNLSSTFVSAPAASVDGRIADALRRLAEFLHVDRAAFGEVAPDGKVELTHFYVLPGVPTYPRTVTDRQLPWWAERVRRGEVMAFARLPDDLPPDAVGERAHCVKDGIRSHLTIPISVGGTVLCILTFVSIRRGRDWPPALISRLRLLGEVFANAVARRRATETFEEQEQSLSTSKKHLRELAGRLLRAQEEERRRVAREMHDDWAQRLALLGILTAQAEASLADPELVGPILRDVQKQLSELAEVVHDISRQLHPSILDDLGLVEALRSECAQVGRREGLEITFEPTLIPQALGGGVALSLYRVAQEAIRNVVKHAAAKSARVTLSADGGELLLRVADDGIGFDPTARSGEPGLGHSSMAERVYIIGGRLTIDAAPGRGTIVEVRASIGGDQS
jgi:two-component system, NarL family, sensor kinase